MLGFNKFKELFLCKLLMTGVVFISACTSETEVEVTGVGYISPTVLVDGSYVDASSSTVSMLEVENYAVPSMLLKSVSGNYECLWGKWTEYNVETGLNVGAYTVSCSVGNRFSEGFSQPWFNAEQQVTVKGGVTEKCELVCRLANSMVTVSYTEAFRTRFEDGGLILHSEGGGFVEYPYDKSEPVFVKSGDAKSIVELAAGESSIRLLADEIKGLKPGYLYGIKVDYIAANGGNPEKILIGYEGVNNNSTSEIAVTDKVMSGRTVDLECVGFESGVSVVVTEGCEPENPVKVVADRSNLKSLMLSVSSSSVAFEGIGGEIDLLKSSENLEKLKALGLRLNSSTESIELDFSELISAIIRNNEFPQSELSVYAVDNLGLVSKPVVIKLVSTVPVVENTGASKSIEGTNRAYLDITTNANLVRYCSMEIKDETGGWIESHNVVVNSTGDGSYRITFDIPEGETALEGRCVYLGQELCRFIVERISPEFTISVDAFALQALVTVECAEPSLRDYIVDNLCVFGNSELLDVSHRDYEQGVVIVTGLKENTDYSFEASIFQSPASGNYVTPEVKVVTETCAQLPNSGFEDIEKGINYKNLPSGGRFSQTIVPVYNKQNYVTYELSVPKKWANCNAKTFCRESTVANSWYMQPSTFTVNDAYSGNYAVKIQSVGWDNKGEKIADYLQEGQPYLNYSRVVPNIAYRAAGKLFLGSYEFNASTTGESYVNGISFSSRPMALNGYYKYSTSRTNVSDRGIVNVELTGLVNGAEVVVAHGTGYLLPTGSYRAFSVDLNYRLYNVKAYRLKIMLASSETTGDISYETANVKTYSNEQTATSTGSELWIDELKLSY